MAKTKITKQDNGFNQFVNFPEIKEWKGIGLPQDKLTQSS